MANKLNSNKSLDFLNYEIIININCSSMDGNCFVRKINFITFYLVTKELISSNQITLMRRSEL